MLSVFSELFRRPIYEGLGPVNALGFPAARDTPRTETRVGKLGVGKRQGSVTDGFVSLLRDAVGRPGAGGNIDRILDEVAAASFVAQRAIRPQTVDIVYGFLRVAKERDGGLGLSPRWPRRRKRALLAGKGVRRSVSDAMTPAYVEVCA